MASNTTVAIVAVVLLGGAAAGAVAFTDVLGGSNAAVDQVPGGVDVVMAVDGDVVTDETTRQLFDAQASETSVDGPQSVDEALSEFENETGLDPTKFEQAVAFGQLPQSGLMMTDQETYGGFIFHADWDTDTVIEEVRAESDVELVEDTYNGQPIYRPAEEPQFGSATTYGVLGDGQFVAGTEAAVEDAIDVTQGDAEAFGGDLRAAFDNTPNGLTRFAMRVPSEQVPDQNPGMGPDVSQFQSVSIVAGSYYTGANNAGVELHVIADSESDATDVSDVIEGGISMASGFSQDDSPVVEHLRSIEVEQSGTTVVVSYERSIDSIQELFEYYRNQGTAIGA